MRIILFFIFLLVVICPALAQKKPLDPAAYDGWQHIGERALSFNGKYIAYTVIPEEGDGCLYIRATGGNYAKEIPRGADVEFTPNGRYAVFLIHPFFKDRREARIRKKTPDQMPKDTLAWIELGSDSIVKIPRVRSYKLPDLQGDWMAYLLEKPEAPAGSPGKPDSLTRIRQLTARADSLARLVDSLRRQIREVGTVGWAAIPSAPGRKEGRSGSETAEEGTELVARDLVSGAQMTFPLTGKYYFNRNGNTLIVETTRKNGDPTSKADVIWVSTANGHVDTIMKGFNDARNYALDEAGNQVAFVAERDSAMKALRKFYRLWYYTPGMDSAAVRVDRSSIAATVAASGLHYPRIPGYVSANAAQHAPAFIDELTVSPDYLNFFSKDGSRLFFGLAPVRPPKDTTLVEFETARLDVWNYNDDYLSPEQLVRLPGELKQSYLAVLPRGRSSFFPLADDSCETVRPGDKGMGRYAIGTGNKEYRIRQQWEQSGLEKVWLVDVTDGSRKLVRDRVRGGATLSPGGKFILWYDLKGRNWYTYETATGAVHNITASIRVPLYDEEDDHPDDPPPHGDMGWFENDRYVYVYDRYDIWQCDPAGGSTPVNLTAGIGRRRQLTFRYMGLDREDPVIHPGQPVLLTVFNNRDKTAGTMIYRMGSAFSSDTPLTHPLSYAGFIKAKNNWTLAWLQGSFDKPYDIWVADPTGSADNGSLQNQPVQLSHINPQQAGYNWLTVELKHWKMLDGRMSEGLLYKPGNFDSTRKYPIIFYFYERDADNLYHYMAPSPDRAVINIPYFVSNGYLVFDPNIYYKTGAPGEDAYNSVISAAHYLARFKWVDTTRMGLEGHSWGGYQVAYLVTRTHLFVAAEAGAPVANMTSAYGGIRWGTGISREFQYEKTQSRIGSTMWQHPELYIKSSPLFRADKVTTPLLMMHNDADGAVPWYQGIEYFSALRRLGKKAWLIEYNGEDHGLRERRNQKDWSLRMSQFFDYYLKGEPPARWITDGVPATLKGIDWGLETP